MSGVQPDWSRLRELPSVERLATVIARDVLAGRREELLSGADDDADLLARARDRVRPSLRRVINATGVIMHTNLGRAPLAPAARAAVAAAAGYAGLELDLRTGARSSRHAHVDALLCELTGAEAALAVNNGAAAVLLAVAALAGPDAPVIVSRGQLVEIGGGFRIPDVIAQAGARLVEVGTTNRTHVADYAAALAAAGGTAVILRVHQSNFRTVGFTAEAGVADLVALGAPVIDDVGSGALDAGAGDEPRIRASVAAGSALVTFSGDKLVGGPQAGLLVGAADAIARCAQHPLARALRIDKLSLAGLEATLRLHRDPELARREIPVLAMLDAPADELRARAERLRAAIGAGELVASTARPGGGALPLLTLDGFAVALAAPGGADALAERLRTGDPAVVARIERDRVLLDVRTIAEPELGDAARAAARALT